MRKIRIRIIISLLIAALMLPMLVSCDTDTVTINVGNWGEYMNPEVLQLFTEETGIEINYTYYTDNENLYALMTGGAAQFDLVFPSDYMIERMIREELIQELDFSNIPNFEYVGDRFKNLAYDPDNLFSVPYMWGTFGILYNTTMVDREVDSWDILWDENYSGQIFMYNIARESFTASLQRLGFSANTTNIDELQAARDELIAQVPLVRAYVAGDGRDKMIGREGALTAIYNGYALLAIAENSELNFAIPNEGGMLWYDSMVIPANARNKREAEEFINFLIRPDIAAMNAKYVGFSVAHMGAFELLPDYWQNDHVFWPPEEKLTNSEILVHLGEFEAQFDRAWTEVMMS